MASIITHRFRKNNVQNTLDEMILPKAMIAGCTSSGNTVTVPGLISGVIQAGMAITTIGSGVLSTSTVTIVTSISTTNSTFTISPTPTATLSNDLVSFYSQYYIGLGKSDPWSGNLEGSEAEPGVPVPTGRNTVDVRNNLIALQKVLVGSIPNVQAIFGNVGYVIPRYDWNSGNFYKAWDPSDPACFYPSTVNVIGGQKEVYPCFVVKDPYLFICINSGYEAKRISATNTNTSPGRSVTAPTTSSGIGIPGPLVDDGYQWAYVGNIALDTKETLASASLIGMTGVTLASLNSVTTGSIASIDSNQFVRIYRNTNTIGTASKMSATASAGKVYSVRVVSGGAGYAVGDTFSVLGDGTSVATGSVSSVSNGTIIYASISSQGSGYSTGVISFTTGAGSGAVLIPRIAPKYGFGYDLVGDLPAWYAGYYGQFSYSDTYPGSSDYPKDVAFRQVSLIRNPVVYKSSSGANYTYRCLKSVTVNTTSTGVKAGDVIQCTSGSGRGYVDSVVTTGSNTLIYYHQNASTFGNAKLFITPIPLQSGSYTIYSKSTSYGTSPGSGTITQVNPPDEYESGTGEVLFTQNRTSVVQTKDSTISIVLVPQF